MTDILKKSTEDLKKFIFEKEETLRRGRFDIAGSAKKGTKSSRHERVEIARALTELATRTDK